MDDRDIFITTNKGQFQYDADFDYYRRVPEATEQSHLSQFGWIYVCAVLTALCYYVTLYA